MKNLSKIPFTLLTLIILSLFSFLLSQFFFPSVYAAEWGKIAKEFMGEALQIGIDNGIDYAKGDGSNTQFYSEQKQKQTSKSIIQHNIINRYKDLCIDTTNSTELSSAPPFQLNNISEIYNRAISLVDSGKCNEALAYFDKVTKSVPSDADAWYEKGITLFMLERYNEALAANNQSLILDPLYPDVWTNIGATLLMLGEYDKALKDMDKALELDPNYVQAQLNKAIILTKLEKYAASLPYYNQYLAQFPNDVYAKTGQGIAFVGLDMIDKAKDSFTKAVESDSSFVLPSKFKERILNEMKEDN